MAAIASSRALDSGYGWVVVAAGALAIGLSAGVYFTCALLLVAIPDEAGWSRAATSTALSSLVLGSGLWAPVVGALIQRLGPRRAQAGSAVLLSTGLLALSLARSPEELALAMVLLISPGTLGAGSLGTYTAVQGWFRERRGTALSLADSGASLGLILVVPLFQQLILAYGWRAALQIFAAGMLLLAPLQLLIQRRPPTTTRRGPLAERSAAGLAELLRLRPLWLVGAGLATSRFGFQLVSIHQAVYLTDQGFDPPSVAGAFALAGLAGLVGRPGFGWLSDRIGTTAVYGALIGCLIFGIANLIVAGQTGLLLPLWLFGLSFGAALGVGTLLFARQLSEFVESRGFAGAMGLTSAIGSLGGVAGGAGAGLAYDATQTYLTSFAAAILMALVSFACMWQLGRIVRGRAS